MAKSLFDSIVNATKEVASNVKSALDEISNGSYKSSEHEYDLDTMDAFREPKTRYVRMGTAEIPDEPDGIFNYTDEDYSGLKDLDMNQDISRPFSIGTYDELMDFYLEMLEGKHEYDMVRMHEIIEDSYYNCLISKDEFFSLVQFIKN